jgi:hypothetical protein
LGLLAEVSQLILQARERLLTAMMDTVFAKIAENTVKFNLGDEEVSEDRSSAVFKADHV